jgi:hypothetical protein
MEFDTNYVQMLSCHVKIMYPYILTNKFTRIGVRIYMLCGGRMGLGSDLVLVKNARRKR